MANSSKENSLLSAYLVVGDDALKRARVLARLRARLEKEGDLSFNFDEFDGASARGTEIVAACNTIPFAAPHRLVFVTALDKLKKDDAEKIISYLDSPNPTTVLLLDSEKLAKNTRLYKAIAKVGKNAILECMLPKGSKEKEELCKLARDFAVSHGVTLAPQAASKLVELIGNNTVRLDNEIAKIALAHNGNDAVSEQEVCELVSRTAEVKPWDFTDAFCARDLKKCLYCLERMDSVAPQALIAMCASRIRELIRARCFIERGQASLLASSAKLAPFIANKQLAFARNFTSSELRRALVYTRDTDRAMKSGTDPHEALYMWTLAVVPKTKR